jgi:hypothetical protein
MTLRRDSLGLLLLHAVQLGFLIVIARHADFCCDAWYYLDTGKQLLRDGILYVDHYAGYRSYFVPAAVALLSHLPVPEAHTAGITFPYAASACFTLFSIAASAHALKRLGWARYLRWAIPLLFNPFLLAYVPYPMQESILVLMLSPLLFLLLAIQDRPFHRMIFLAVLIAALAYFIRSSLLWFVAPVIAFVIVDVRGRLSRAEPLKIGRAVALGLIAFVPLAAPQSYIAYEKFGTVRPYPSGDVANNQLVWGPTMYKYATLKTATGWQGLRYATSAPTTASATIASESRTAPATMSGAAFYWQYPMMALPIVLGHVWAGLHYDTLVPYITTPLSGQPSPELITSSLVVILGLLALWSLRRQWHSSAPQMFLVTTLVMSCAYTAFVATEARFGLLGFAALSIAAAGLPFDENLRRASIAALPMILLYVLASCLINALLFGTIVRG